MKKASIVLLGVLLLLISNVSFASTKCGYLPVTNLIVFADRENGSLYANTLRISVKNGVCDGVDYAYLSNTHPAYEGILMSLLSGGQFHVWVKDSLGIYPNAREIEWLAR